MGPNLCVTDFISSPVLCLARVLCLQWDDAMAISWRERQPDWAGAFPLGDKIHKQWQTIPNRRRQLLSPSAAESLHFHNEVRLCLSLLSLVSSDQVKRRSLHLEQKQWLTMKVASIKSRRHKPRDGLPPPLVARGRDLLICMGRADWLADTGGPCPPFCDVG